MDDVLVVGAGPAGAVAATVLARAGARVRLIDRATFPRDKLCGDTLNPGTLAMLRRLGLAGGSSRGGCRSTACASPAKAASRSRAATRAACTAARSAGASSTPSLLEQAIAAGAAFDGVAVREAIVDESRHGAIVRGVAGRRPRIAPRAVVIAADGRRSTVAFGLGLARHPPGRGAGRSARTSRRRDPLDVRRDAHPPRPLHRRRAGAGGLTNVCLVSRGRAVTGPERSRGIAISAIRPVCYASDRRAIPCCATDSPAARPIRHPSCSGRWRSTSRRGDMPGCCWPAMPPASSIR